MNKGHRVVMTADEACSDDALDSEIRALEKMLEARCKQIEFMVGAASRKGDGESREQDFQIQAFAERRDKAREQLSSGIDEARNARIVRLERLLEALECSRDFFSSHHNEDGTSREEWAVLIR